MARIENLTAEEEMISRAGQLQRECQRHAERGTYAKLVIREGFSKAPPTKKQIHELLADLEGAEVGVTTRSFNLKKSAINSPDIALDSEVIDVKGVFTCMQESVQWLWEQAFQNEILDAIPASNRFVVRRCPPIEMLLASSATAQFVEHPYAIRVNIFGKRVSPFVTTTTGRKDINPKYMKAAKLVVGFDPDIVHFVFPDIEKWACNIVWKNIPDREYNPFARIGFYQAHMSYGAKVMRPDLGYVFTVLPPGLKGWLWEKAWKLFKFVP